MATPKKPTFFQRKSQINQFAHRKLHHMLQDVNLIHTQDHDQSTHHSKKNSNQQEQTNQYYFGLSKSQKKILSTDQSTTKLTQSALSLNPVTAQTPDNHLIIYGDLNSLNNIKVTIIQVFIIQSNLIKNHFKPINIQQLYQNNQNIFNQICQTFQTSIKYFFLPNMQPIGFFEEIPQNVRVIIVSNNFQCNFWQRLFRIHFLKNQQWEPIYSFLSRCTTESQAIKVLKSKHLLQMAQKQEILIDCDFLPDSTLINKILYKDQPWYRRSSELSEIALDEETKKNQKKKNDSMDKVLKEDEQNDFIMMKQNIRGDQLKGLMKQQKKKVNNSYFNLQSDISKKFIEQNKQKYSCLLRKIHKKMPLLSSQNIPQQLSELSIDRRELYNKYTKYKTLLYLQQEQNIESGLNFETFYYGLDDQRMAPIDLIKNLFLNYSDMNRMKWNDYMKVIDLLQATSTQSKIQLIIRLIDKNKDGILSYEEILERCDIMLQKIIPSENKDNKLFSLSDFMSRTIFEAVGNRLDQDIQIFQIKKMIEQNHPQVNLLLMICCGDMHNDND